MIDTTTHTLVNPQNGNLAFKVFSFEGHSRFDHLQRLNYYTMILVLKGTGKLVADFSEYEIAADSLICFSPYQPFLIKEANDLQGVVVNFHPDFFCIHKHHAEVACNGVLFNNIYQPPFHTMNTVDMQKLLTLVEEMKTEMQQPAMAQYELLISYLKIFLISASRTKAGLAQDHLTEKNDGPFQLQKLKDYIETHYRKKRSPAEYAEMLNISPKALAKLTKHHYNKTLTDLITERVVIEAKRELYLTSKPVKEIAHDLGFNDEFYFSRFFKTNVDVSPQLYRETVGVARGEA